MKRKVAYILLVLACVLGFGCGGPNHDAPAAAKPEGESTSAPVPKLAVDGAFWPTYHGSPSLEGVVDIELGDSLVPAWNYEAEAGIANPPVTGVDRICVADNKGTLHALDWKGQKAWTKAFTRTIGSDQRQVPMEFSAPLALFGSTLIACTATGTIYTLNVQDGSEKWTADTKCVILGTPSLLELEEGGSRQSRLFLIDQSEGSLQCFDFNDGSKLWSSEGVGRCDGSPSVSSQWVVFGSCACAIHVFQPGSKEMVREIALDEESQVANGVVIAGDSLFSSSRSGQFVHANARTGQIVWQNKDCQGESFGTPAVDADSVVFTSNDQTVYALERATGKLRWKQKLASTPTSPVIAKDKVMVSAGGTLYMLRLSDGKILWSYEVSDLITSPSIAGNLVLVGSDDGTVTAFSSPQKQK